VAEEECRRSVVLLAVTKDPESRRMTCDRIPRKEENLEPLFCSNVQ
jgi:hypothetical protein